MNIEKMREEFEAALIAMHVSTGLPKSTATAMIEVKCNGQYASPSTMGAWWAWQASRESLVIELPIPETPEDYEISEEDDQEEYARLESRAGAQYTAIYKCKKAIEAAGLKVKP